MPQTQHSVLLVLLDSIITMEYAKLHAILPISLIQQLEPVLVHRLPTKAMELVLIASYIATSVIQLNATLVIQHITQLEPHVQVVEVTVKHALQPLTAPSVKTTISQIMEYAVLCQAKVMQQLLIQVEMYFNAQLVVPSVLFQWQELFNVP